MNTPARNAAGLLAVNVLTHKTAHSSARVATMRTALKITKSRMKKCFEWAVDVFIVLAGAAITILIYGSLP